MISTSEIWTVVLSVVLVMFSAIVHEVAHGYAALLLGDTTAKRAGRLTLNPAAHLDPFGSVILPLMMALAGGPVFAIAKPVPYNPRNLRHPDRDEVLVALAGPASNLLQALAGTLVYHLIVNSWRLFLYTFNLYYWIIVILSLYIYINLVLCFFNLIPLPPLDGSKIIMPLLKGDARRQYYQIQRYSIAILLAVLYLVPMVLKFDPLGIYIDATAGRLYDVLMGIGF